MIITISLVNIHHLIDTKLKKWKKKFFLVVRTPGFYSLYTTFTYNIQQY